MLDASGNGAAAAAATIEIRTLFRPGTPDIDSVPVEQLPKLVQGVLNDLKKPGPKPSDFSGAVAPALPDAR